MIAFYNVKHLSPSLATVFVLSVVASIVVVESACVDCGDVPVDFGDVLVDCGGVLLNCGDVVME